MAKASKKLNKKSKEKKLDLDLVYSEIKKIKKKAKELGVDAKKRYDKLDKDKKRKLIVGALGAAAVISTVVRMKKRKKNDK